MQSKQNQNDQNDSVLKTYGKYIAVVAVAIVLIIIITLTGKSGSKTTAADTTSAAEAAETAAVSESGAETAADTASETEETTTEDANEMKEDAYPEVNALVETYFNALRDQDIDTLSSITVSSTGIDADAIAKEGEYIEDYQNIKCYTKKGLKEGTYVVFAYYEIKFMNVDTPAPSMIWMYVCTADDGSLYINQSTVDGDDAAYIDEILQGDEVAAIAENVNESLTAAMESDETLAQLVTKMKEGADPTLIAETEAETAAEEETEAQESDTASSESSESTGNTEKVYATETVNIRKEASKDAEIAGKLLGGSSIERVGTTGEWSIVRYHDEDCYIISEYLTTSLADEDGYQSVDETVEALQNVKVRSSASTDSEALGTLTGGSKIHRIGVGDKWSKVEFQGETGYVMSEYLR